MNSNKTMFVPLAFVGLMFFAIGFALGINSLLVPVLQGSLNISGAASYLIIAATFIPFLIFGYPAGLTIKSIGYKKTMSLSFLIFAAAFYLFILSAEQKSFSLFLTASFISGAANAFLQASVNPYITILGPIESAAKRISIMGICNKLAWPIPALFIVWLLGKDVNLIGIEDLTQPFIIIIIAFVVLGVMAFFAPLPEVKAEGEDESDSSSDAGLYASSKTSVFQFPHLLLGCLALFLYVGVETVSLGTLVDYANALGLDGASNYAWIAPIGIVIGYICGIIFIPKYMSQATALKICSILALVGSLLVVCVPASVSIYFISFMALGCSLMWPALWPLAMADLGKFTKSGSSLLIMAMFGGAVIPTLYGWLKDLATPQQAYWLCVPCFLFILWYGMVGYKIRTKK
ncbi:glucose/galactose MFS transporter [Bacteroides timonensis]|uniref:glucose/galactose MFS transporter n=1 Tax=Bacteroides timonensis TaxID=1470345 RepID=UPI0004B1EAAF|nr:glucose/galactose MFS transporter [Bacteroides timonensis]